MVLALHADRNSLAVDHRAEGMESQKVVYVKFKNFSLSYINWHR